MPGVVIYPFAFSTLRWESLPAQWNLTVCLKASYALAPSAGEPTLSSQKDGLHEDVHFDASPGASLYSPSDFVPFKARADVLLVGEAHAPGGVPTESLLVRLRVGDLSKTLRVTGERAWVETPQGPRASAPRPFTKAPLRYERASQRGENLAGIPPGDRSRPPAAIDLVPEEGPAETPGFGPIAASWRASRDPGVQDVLAWSQRLRAAPPPGPPPAGADATAFNSAPRDQQRNEIPPGGALVLDHLHPRFARLEARIPSIVPRVFCADGSPREVPMRIDTVWIDTEREVFVVSWRGFVSTAPPIAASSPRVLVAAHPRGETATFDEIEAVVRGAGAPLRSLASPAARAPEKTAALAAVVDAPAVPFPVAASAAPHAANASAPIAGAPWTGLPALPVTKPGHHLAETAQTTTPLRAKRQAPGTTAMAQVTGPAPPAAPFPLAAPGAAAPSAPLEGAPWTGLPAAPVPKPTGALETTMPLGSSMVEVLAKAKQLAARTAEPPAIATDAAVVPAAVPPGAEAPVVPVEPSPVVAPQAPAEAPSPAQPVWRVDEPVAAPPPPPAPPKRGPDAKQELYGAFTRKQK